ncbi:MAG TPA: GNAT family N-acetyltransferase [Galbitalea sp.]|jgi:ribosomal protein S18 acetylase RimI-like enzyme
MAIELHTPSVADLPAVVNAMRGWQLEGAPMQLHPGDIGWLWRFGGATTAAAVRTWTSDGRILAVGMLDGADLLRLTTAPGARRDRELAGQLADDLATPARGILRAGRVFVEAPADAMLQDLLAAAGWDTDEPWTPLRRILTEPVQHPGVRIEVVGTTLAEARSAVQRSAFEGSTFTTERWQVMAAAPSYADADARCLMAYDDDDNAVAAVTVWSAGDGRPGLLEPMGVHRDHRGRGYGRAIAIAAAAALRYLGSSSAIVCTRSSNLGGVATYKSAGFEPLAEVRDRRRDA